MSEENCAVILAAGEGKRMKHRRPKALSPVLFKPMLQWVLDSVRDAGIHHTCVVTGYLHEQVEQYLILHDPETATVLQSHRLGTGHAVKMATGFLRSHATGGNVLILNGDAPFIDPAILSGALELHEKNENSVTVISAELSDPTGYGRIIRDAETGLVAAIVEQKDASPAERAVREVNSGAFWFKTSALLDVLTRITNNNTQGEYYLTDAVKLLICEGRKADAYKTASTDAVLGANDCVQLNELNAVARRAILNRLMTSGTEIPCTDGILIGPDVSVGEETCILPGTILRGNTSVGRRCIIGPSAVLSDCTVGNGTALSFVSLSRISVCSENTPAPFTSQCNPLK